MTYDEFLDALPREGWELRRWGDRATIRRGRPWPYAECPITSFEGLPIGDFRLCWDIAHAADDAPGHDPAIRRDLLLACGLKPREEPIP